MPAFAKIKAGRVNTLDFSQFVGEEGHLFYNVITGELRISDGHTVGGNPIAITASTINTASILPDIDDTYGLGSAYYRWNHVHVGSGGIYLDGTVGTDGLILRVDAEQTLTFDGGTGNLAVGSVTFPDNSRQTQAFIPNAILESLIPVVTDQYNLGSPTRRWANVYIGSHSLHLLDQTRLTDVSITVNNGTLYLNGARNLAVGNLVILDTTLQSLTTNLDISIGDTNDTGIFRIKRKTAVTNTTFSDTESAFVINANGEEPVTLFPDTLLTTVARPNKNSRIVQRAYGADPVNPAINAYPVWASYVARGNVAVPASTQSGDILMRLSANGRGTTGWGAGGARVEVVALETFTDIAKGTQINFWTTPVGSSTTVNSASVKSSGFTGNAFTFTTDNTTQSTAGIPMTYRGNLQANKVATLGIDGRLDTSQIPTSLTGAIVFQGGWDAANNSPTLSNGTGTTGYEYIVTTGGTANLGTKSVTYAQGDFVIYGSGVWEYIQGTSPFVSLTGGQHITVDQSTGAMTLGSDATPNYTSGTIVSRDNNGNFVANVITATLSGSASTAATASTVTNPEQTTITKLGTLGNLSVSGNVSATYYTGSGLYLTGVAKSSDIAGANAAISSLTGSISGANAAIATINGNVAGANAAINTNTNNLAGANAAIATLQTQVYANANVAAYLASFSGTVRAGNITVTGSISDANGNVRNLPVVNKSTGYTLQASDAGNLVSISSGNVTVPASVFVSPYGQAISIFNNNSVATNVIQSTNVTLRLAGTAATGNRTLARYGIASMVCVAANTFVISGAGLT